MKLANLYQTLLTADMRLATGAPAKRRRRVDLANSMIRDVLDEYARLEAYERDCSPTFENPAEDADAVAVLRSIAQMFESWLEDAQPLYGVVTQLPAAWQDLPQLAELRDAIGFARVRLVGTPEEELRGVQQARRGEVVHYASVEEMRNELRAQRRG